MIQKEGSHLDTASAVIDWEAIHRRMEQTQQALERGEIVTDEEKRKILAARAMELARQPASEEQEQKTVEVLEFALANERYGIESGYVREVYPIRDVTPLPCTPPFVCGIINMRGQILSVIDIKKFFGLPEKGLTDLNNVIVVRNSVMEVGILADSIVAVRHVRQTEIQPPLPTLTGIREEYLRGVTNERLIILDMEKFLSDQKMIVNELVTSQ